MYKCFISIFVSTLFLISNSFAFTKCVNNKGEMAFTDTICPEGYKPVKKFNEVKEISSFKKTDANETSGRLGEMIEIKGRRIVVYSIQQYADSSMQSFGGDTGYAMEVLIENTTESPFYLNPLHFTVQNEKGMAFTYLDTTGGGKRPKIRSEDVAPGQKIRGYITYVSNEIPYVVYYKNDGITVRINL